MIRLLFISGSPRNASAAYAIDEAKKAAQEIEDVEVSVLKLSGKKIAPCIGCNTCVGKGMTKCVIYHDDMDEWNDKFFSYDGVLIGTPVYDMGITPQLTAFISRFRGEYLNQKKDPLNNMYMPGAAIAVGGTRNGGQETAIHIIHGFYYTQGMPVVSGGLGVYAGASLWSKDKKAEGTAEDTAGMDNVRFLAKKLALTAKALNLYKSNK